MSNEQDVLVRADAWLDEYCVCRRCGEQEPDDIDSIVTALRDEVRRLRESNRVIDQVANGVRDLIREVQAARDAARYAARILAHAYQTDNRPPENIVDEALAFPVKP